MRRVAPNSGEEGGRLDVWSDVCSGTVLVLSVCDWLCLTIVIDQIFFPRVKKKFGLINTAAIGCATISVALILVPLYQKWFVRRALVVLSRRQFFSGAAASLRSSSRLGNLHRFV